MAKRKLKTLTLEEKVRVIATVEENAGIKRKKDIASEFGIPPNTLSTIFANKDKIKQQFEQSGSSSSSKRARQSDYPDIDEALVKWFQQLRTNNSKIPTSGSFLREKALSFAQLFSHIDFVASSGWLERFKVRHNIVFKTMCGEAKDVPKEACSDWLQSKLNNLLNEYPEHNIFNADETGLFFKCLPNRTMTFKGESCSGGKMSKERITVLIGANMDGSKKLPLLVIEKAKKPRCFANVRSLPVMYENNKKAWMTSSIFETYVRKLYDKMHSQKRKIVLLIDNCPAHPNLENLKAIQLEFFPPNTTTSLQPADQGIIKNFKFYYRKRLVGKLLEEIERNEQQQMNTTLLDAIRILNIAWNEDVTSKTIANCFKKAGFIRPSDTVNILENPVEQLEPTNWELVTNSGITFNEFISIDNNVEVCEQLTDEDIVAEVTQNRQVDASDEEEDQYPDVPLPTNKEAIQAVGVVQCYLEGQPDVPEQMFLMLNKIENLIGKSKMGKQQSSILDYFQR